MRQFIVILLLFLLAGCAPTRGIILPDPPVDAATAPDPDWLYYLVLRMRLREMGGGGHIKVIVETSTKPLCDATRKILWSQLRDVKDGSLGDCTFIPIQSITAPKIDK